jgi:hypothetical protein
MKQSTLKYPYTTLIFYNFQIIKHIKTSKTNNYSYEITRFYYANNKFNMKV